MRVCLYTLQILVKETRFVHLPYAQPTKLEGTKPINTTCVYHLILATSICHCSQGKEHLCRRLRSLILLPVPHLGGPDLPTPPHPARVIPTLFHDFYLGGARRRELRLLLIWKFRTRCVAEPEFPNSYGASFGHVKGRRKVSIKRAYDRGSHWNPVQGNTAGQPTPSLEEACAK